MLALVTFAVSAPVISTVMIATARTDFSEILFDITISFLSILRSILVDASSLLIGAS